MPGQFGNGSVRSDDVVDHVVDGNQAVLEHRDHVKFERKKVVPGPGARLRLGGQQQLVADGGDEVDRDLDVVGFAPSFQELLQDLIRARYPMVDDPEPQPAS